ncbi:hypothetical protein DV735_g4127, partial [Chaetothyriales sp. CBS 134920]
MGTRSRDSLSTPDIPAGTAVLTVYSSTRIAAPASLVFRTLRNTDTWRDWNRFTPRVTMNFQPPEIDDHVTAAEIRELIKNTSLAGSVDSDITDGAVGGTGSLTGRRLSLEEKENIRRSPPPVTRERLRSVASIASSTDTAASSSHQQRRFTSAGLPERPNYAAPMAATMEKQRLSIHALYGEPSVRIQLDTKMTLYCRMSLPKSWSTDREIQVVVTEVSRPDDDITDNNGNNDNEDSNNTHAARLRKATTHTQNKSGVYRIVWTLRSSYSMSTLAASSAKFLSQAQRVHEIRPVIAGDGSEECVYDDWECHRGMLAKAVKSKYQDYLDKRFDEWGNGLKAYCEALGGAVERRDFVNSP